jgi:predicted acylesterase/phospholipase RssA
MEKKILTPEQIQSLQEIKVPAWVYALLIYALIVAFFQGGWSKAVSVYVAAILLALIAGFIPLFTRLAKTPIRLLAFILALATIAWFYLTDSYRYGWLLLWDALGIVLGTLALFAIARATSYLPASIRNRLPALKGSVLVISIVIAAWTGVTLVSVMRSSSLRTDPAYFSTITPAKSLIPEIAERWKDRHVGVTLSGGGYRAAIFHAGTLHAMETLGIRPTALSTVSGGSIIGAYYALGGDPTEFKAAVQAGRFNLKRELMLLHNAVRLPAPLELPGLGVRLFPFYNFSRLDVQRTLLRNTLFNGRTEWPAPISNQPELMLATTDLAYGLGVGMLRDGMLVVASPADTDAYRGSAYKPKDQLDLPFAVATSGAFPLAFPTVEYTVSVMPYHASGTGARRLRLSDGGIFDNLGLDLAMAARHLGCRKKACDPSYEMSEPWVVDVIVVSDAGAIDGIVPNASGISALSRAFDVVSAKSAGARAKPPAGDAYPITLSARGAFSVPNMMLFNLEDGSDVSNDPTKIGRVRFNPQDQYPAPILRAIVSLLSDKRRDEAADALNAYLENTRRLQPLDPVARQAWTTQFNHTKTAQNCIRSSKPSDMPPPPFVGLCEAVALRNLIWAELSDCLITFKNVSTLDSWPRAGQIDRVYRLGQLLVYLNWWQFDRALGATAPPAEAVSGNG